MSEETKLADAVAISIQELVDLKCQPIKVEMAEFKTFCNERFKSSEKAAEMALAAKDRGTGQSHFTIGNMSAIGLGAAGLIYAAMSKH